MKKNAYIIGCFLIAQMGFAQIKINSNLGTTSLTNHTAFLDASSSTTWNTSTNNGKGLIFPRVNLTTLATMIPSTSLATNNPNRFDGMLVYNTATGTSAIGAKAVKPGFFYYSNQSTNVNGGTWISIGEGTSTLGVVATVAAYTVLDTDSTIFCDATAGPFTVTLPNPVVNNGKVLVIRKTDATYNEITFSPALFYSQEVTTVSSLNYVKTIRIQSDGTNWNIID